MEGSSLSIEYKSEGAGSSRKQGVAKVPAPIWTNAFWHSDMLNHVSQKKLSIVMAAPEDVTAVFGPNWLRMCTRGDKYRADDLNLPIFLPFLTVKGYDAVADPPLTNFGKMYAHTMSQVLGNQQFKIRRIFCGPYLRQIQTAAVMAKRYSLNAEIVRELVDVKVDVEKVEMSDPVKRFLTLEELKKCDDNCGTCKMYTFPDDKAEDEASLLLPSSTELNMAPLLKLLQHLTSLDGPVMIITGPLNLALVESVSELPEGYVRTDSTFNLANNGQVVDINAIVKLKLDQMPGGWMEAFERGYEDELTQHPDSLPRLTVLKDQPGHCSFVSHLITSAAGIQGGQQHPQQNEPVGTNSECLI